MKKLLALMLVLMMSVFVFAACNDKDAEPTDNSVDEKVANTENKDEVMNDTEVPSLDELLANAVELDGHTFCEEYERNKVKLNSQYEGKPCIVEGIIAGIESDHIVVTDSNLKVNVYIPTEEIMELEKNQYVEVVGILENIGFEQNMSLIWVTVDFTPGYVSKSTYTKTGEYYSHFSTDGSHPQGVSLKCLTDAGKSYYVELEFAKEQKGTLANGQEITVEGRLFVNDNDMPYSAYTKLIVDTIK